MLWAADALISIKNNNLSLGMKNMKKPFSHQGGNVRDILQLEWKSDTSLYFLEG